MTINPQALRTECLFLQWHTILGYLDQIPGTKADPTVWKEVYETYKSGSTSFQKQSELATKVAQFCLKNLLTTLRYSPAPRVILSLIGKLVYRIDVSKAFFFQDCQKTLFSLRENFETLAELLPNLEVLDISGRPSAVPDQCSKEAYTALSHAKPCICWYCAVQANCTWLNTLQPADILRYFPKQKNVTVICIPPSKEKVQPKEDLAKTIEVLATLTLGDAVAKREELQEEKGTKLLQTQPLQVVAKQSVPKEATSQKSVNTAPIADTVITTELPVFDTAVFNLRHELPHVERMHKQFESTMPGIRDQMLSHLFKAYANAHTLYLHENMPMREIKNLVATLKKVRIIYFPRGTDKTIQYLQPLKQLEQLYIENPRIKTIDSVKLLCKSLTNLTTLHIIGCNLSLSNELWYFAWHFPKLQDFRFTQDKNSDQQFFEKYKKQFKKKRELALGAAQK